MIGIDNNDEVYGRYILLTTSKKKTFVGPLFDELTHLRFSTVYLCSGGYSLKIPWRSFQSM